MNQSNDSNQPVVLAIAGFDPSGGAGVIADVRTFLQFDCRPVAAVTSITFQNSEAMFGAIHESAESVRAQVLPVIQETKPDALKLGMIPTAEIVVEVARLIRDYDLPAPVIDPVMRSSSEYELVEAPAVEALQRELIPLARLITPNIPEAEVLTGMRIEDEQGMRDAAQKLREIGAPAVLVKGGHLTQVAGAALPDVVDILNHGGRVTEFRSERIKVPPVHGTGCMLSAAIAACLAQGVSLEESIRLAKDYVAEAIRFCGAALIP